MKRILLLGTLLVLNAFAADDFWAQLTPEERAAAGVADLTPAQRTALDQLAGRFAREGARQATTVAVAKAREETKAEAEKEFKQREVAQAGRSVEKTTVAAVRSRIAGEFRGWNGRTTFRLENGQLWAQTDSTDTYLTPAQASPEVEVRPAGFGSWKLYLMPEERWVRVRRAN